MAVTLCTTYQSLALQHDTRNTVDYWRSLNSPGYEVHAAAVALRQDMKDSSNLKSENDDLNDLVHSARKIYPPRIPLQTQSPPPASDPKPGKLKSTLRQQTHPR